MENAIFMNNLAACSIENGRFDEGISTIESSLHILRTGDTKHVPHEFPRSSTQNDVTTTFQETSEERGSNEVLASKDR